MSNRSTNSSTSYCENCAWEGPTELIHTYRHPDGGDKMFLCADCLEKQEEDDKKPKSINYECIDCDEEVTCDTLPNGWKQVSGCDYCPGCAAELEEEESVHEDDQTCDECHDRGDFELHTSKKKEHHFICGICKAKEDKE